MKKYVELVDWIDKIIEYILLVLMIFLVVAVTLQIIGRLPFFSFKVSMLEELSRFDMVAIAYLSLALLMRGKKWKITRVDALPELLKGKAQKVLDEICYIFTLIIALIILSICPKFVQLGMAQKAPGSGIPMGVFYMIIPIGLVLMLLNWFATSLERWGVVKNA